MRYFSSNSEEMHVSEGLSAIIGVQEVLIDKNKIHVWMRQEVERPASTDRHRTTRMANNTHRKHEWGKSVWLKEEFWKHFGGMLEKTGITKKILDTFQDDPDCDLWVTKSDNSTRKFLQVFIINPKSEINRKALNIQITQVAGKAPIDIYQRAFDESKKGFGDYKVLADKYKNNAMVKTYSSYVSTTSMVINKRLTPVFVTSGEDKLPVYETSEIVLGEPNHIWVDYERHDSTPIDVLEFIETNEVNVVDAVILGTKVPEEKELILNFDK